ncbi:ABC transporter permease [Methanobrevibacter curvatus]|uniref:ABC-2 type transporter n=1 Tax=Methanobrevibacter curvatus TaxID=49547 RepID=A0A166AIF2_9EURY|nr:ABC transporter permease [Methanobrevibacter curvatus]KZX12073.1 ABC-2 type transporter [Methanobrevibacter curvatus]
MNKTSTYRKSDILRELNSIIAVAARDIIIFFKSPGMMIMSIVMPLIMMGMIGGNMMGIPGGESLGEFMLVGMLVSMLLMVTIMGMASLVDDHETDFTQEMLVSPMSRYSLVIGKIIGSTFVAIISMIGTLIIGLVMNIVLSIDQLLLILLLSPLICFVGGAVSMILMGLIKSKKTANFAMMIITMPQMFLSGAIIPINDSNLLLLVLSRIMPMTYCVDLVRGVTGIQPPMFSPLTNFAAIILLTFVCLVIGTVLFARSEKNR